MNHEGFFLTFLSQDSATAEKGLEEVPNEGEDLRLLEERRRVHIPDDSQRVIPSKKREMKKKERKRKSDSSSHGESAWKKASVGTIMTAVPLQMSGGGGGVFPEQGVADFWQGEGEGRGINRCPRVVG